MRACVAILILTMAGDAYAIRPRSTGPKGPQRPLVQSPDARIVITKHAADEASSLSSAAVAARIRSSYTFAINDCYRHVSLRDPKATGKLVIELTVGDNGRAKPEDIFSFDREFEACIRNAVRRWTFPIPKQRGQPAEASFTIELAVAPKPPVKAKPVKPKPVAKPAVKSAAKRSRLTTPSTTRM